MAAEGTAIVIAKSFDIGGTVATLHVVHLPERARSQIVKPWLLILTRKNNVARLFCRRERLSGTAR